MLFTPDVINETKKDDEAMKPADQKFEAIEDRKKRLFDELNQALNVTVEGLAKAAKIYRQLVELGERESLHAKLGQVARVLERISQGSITPELAISATGAGNHWKMRALDGMAPDRQRELLQGAPVKVYEPETKQVIEVPFTSLDSKTAARVFASGVQRSIDEQKLIVGSTVKTATKSEPEPVKRRHTVTVDAVNGTLKISGMVVPIATIMAALAEAGGCRGVLDLKQHADKYTSESIPLTHDEAEKFAMAAKAAGLSKPQFGRRALMAWVTGR